MSIVGMRDQEGDNRVQSAGQANDSREVKDVSIELDDWEVVEDDGFIFKRRKVQDPPIIPAIPSVQIRAQAPKVENKLSEAGIRRQKMAKLLAQKERYSAEIRSWETLLQQVENLADCQVSAISTDEDEDVKLSKIENSSVLDDIQALELQVTAHEEFIRRLGELPTLGDKIAQQLEAGLLESEWKFKDKLLQDVPTKTPRTAIHALT